MDRSAARAIVDREIQSLPGRLGIPHWDVQIGLDLRGDDGVSRIAGQCTVDIDRNKAFIEFCPDEIDDEGHLLEVLRHELFHVVLSPFDLFTSAVDEALAGDDAGIRVLKRIRAHAVEKAVINLERMYQGLTKGKPEPEPEGDEGFPAAIS
jgi:hypothetical protein